MSISLTCACGRQFEISEAYAGGQARCPDCGREWLVPKPAPPPDLEFNPLGPDSSATSGTAVASLVLGCLFFLACLSGVPAILLGRQALGDIQRSKGRLKGRRLAITGIVLGLIGCLLTVALILPAFRSAREAARRSQCVNNLKGIGLALHNYHEVHGSLPAAAITDPNGRPLLSWRVALLPYLGSESLYAKFHLDEPWDSPHNRALLDSMPPIYACPSDRDRQPGTSGYQVVIGAATAFTPDFKPSSFQDFTDGLNHTFLIGESRHDVPWTRPEDINLGVPLNGLGSYHGYHHNGFNALFADGSVRFIKISIKPSVLGAILTRNGNEVVAPDDYY